MQFDYIIIGAGSAGAVVANRLSADARHTVLLLEAGGSDRRAHVQIPLGYGLTYYDAGVNWKYQTEPVPGLGMRQSYWPRGKVLGGSSAINAMVYVRGHPLDYDDWAMDARGWSWKDVEPVFRHMERWAGTPNAHRGDSGPLHISDIHRDAHPLCQHYLAAAAEMQLLHNEDYNRGAMEGVGLYQITTHRGLRASTAHCYLRPVMQRSNLTVRLHAHVDGIDFDDRRASAVRFRERGRACVAFARREVVVCAGAVNSPQLLQLSGIGPGEEMQRLGIPLVHHSPAVGQHLKDHLGADIICRSHEPTLNQALYSWPAKCRAALYYAFRRRGPLSLSLNQAGGFVRTRSDLDRPDQQLYFSPVSYTRAPPGSRPLMSPDRFPGFLLGYNPCKPTSEGTITLRSPDPVDAPVIQPEYLSTERDCQSMLDGMRLIRTLAGTQAFQKIIDKELQPGVTCQSDEQFMDYIRDNAWTVFHPCGTCRMGSSAMSSVVDARLRVHGVSGLRVADASIFPDIPTGNTNAPSIMVGEKASQLLLNDAKTD